MKEKQVPQRQHTRLIFGYVGRKDLREALYHVDSDLAARCGVVEKEIDGRQILHNAELWINDGIDGFSSVEIDCEFLSLEAKVRNSLFDSFFEEAGISNAGAPEWYLISYVED